MERPLYDKNLLWFAFFLLVVSAGCRQSVNRWALPAPAREQDEARFVGKICRVWGGDNFEFGGVESRHYVLLAGVTCPAPGEPGYWKSRSNVFRIVRGQEITVDVIRRDEFMREIAFVTVLDESGREFDLGEKLIRLGWGKWDGTEVAKAEAYRIAQQSAQQAGLGLWQPKFTSPENSTATD